MPVERRSFRTLDAGVIMNLCSYNPCSETKELKHVRREGTLHSPVSQSGVTVTSLKPPVLRKLFLGVYLAFYSSSRLPNFS